MTATDELRRMLDERGVEWMPSVWSAKDETFYMVGEVGFLATELSSGRMKVSVEGYPTPEQAIEATLGRGTCHPVTNDNLTESEGTGDAWADCSECGHPLCVLTDPSSQMPNYCPNCGAKVVDDASVD